MKVTIKTLQGKTFSIEAEGSDSVGKVKGVIATSQGEAFAADRQKLIHAGKVMKDDQPLSEYNVTEESFLVCMLTKPKAAKKAAAPATSAPAGTASSTSAAPTTATATSSSSSSSASTSSSSTPSAAATSSPATSSASATGAATASTSTPSNANESGNTSTSAAPSAAATTTPAAPDAAVQQLMDMGFPEDQVRLALRAAFNNPDRAVEYLMSGIPENANTAPSSAPSSGSGGQGAVSGASFRDIANASNPLEALRRHPQFDNLRGLVQSNPSALPAVLENIGNQSPELLNLIHQNQMEFVEMLNEPITNPPASSTPSATPASGGTGIGAPGSGGGGLGALGGLNPAQFSQMITSLPPEQQAQMAQMMGVPVEQLQQISQMMANLPPEALQQIMQQMEGAGGAAGAGAGLGRAPGMPGVHTVQLTEEEAAAVNRLCDMGFDRNDVIQAYLACEKNEALAANFLMDSMTADMNMDTSGGTGGGASGAGNSDSNDDIYG